MNLLRLTLPVFILLPTNVGSHGLAAPPDLYIRHLQSPIYSNLARNARFEGDVRLRVVVNKEGHVAKTDVISPSGPKLLQKNASENIQEWTFNEGSERVFEIVYEFRLVAPELDCVSPTVVVLDFPSKIRIQTNFQKTFLD